MNWLDVFLAIILLIGIVRGFLHGFVYEIANLGAFFIGLYFGFALTEKVAPHIAKVFDAGPTFIHYISLFIVFLAIWIGMILLSKLFEGLINVAMLGIFNKLAGAIFGGTKFFLLLSLFIFFFHKVDSKYHWISPDTKAESTLYYPLLKTGPAVMPVLKNVESKVHELK